MKYVDKLRDDDLLGGFGEVDYLYFGFMKFDFVTMIVNFGGDVF